MMIEELNADFSRKEDAGMRIGSHSEDFRLDPSTSKSTSGGFLSPERILTATATHIPMLST
jgi:hypothetical protein